MFWTVLLPVYYKLEFKILLLSIDTLTCEVYKYGYFIANLPLFGSDEYVVCIFGS